MNEQNNFNSNNQGAYQGCAPVSNFNSLNTNNSGINVTQNTNNQMYPNNGVVQNTGVNNQSSLNNGVVQNTGVNNQMYPNDGVAQNTGVNNQMYPNNSVVQNTGVNNQMYPNNSVVQNTGVNNQIYPNNGVVQNTGVNNQMYPNNGVVQNTNVNNIMKSLDNNVFEEKPKSKFRKVILFLIIILIILGVIYYVFFKNKETDANLSVVFDIDKPILIFNSDKKCGYFDYNGNQIIDFKYVDGTQFYNGYAGVILDQDKEDYAIIDLNGNEIIKKTGGEKPQYLIDYDIWVIGDAFYNNKISQVSPSNYSITYSDNGLFIFKDFDKNETGVINHKNEVLYSMYGTEGVEIEISHSNYDVEELFLKVKTADSVVVVSTLTDDLIYTHESNNELYAYEDGLFYTLTSNGKRDFKYFNDGKLTLYWEGVDYVHIADYEKQIIFSEIDGYYRYYDVKEEYQLSTPPEKNEYFEILNGSNYYDYEFYECGAGKGLKKDDDIILECGYSDIKYLNINLFNYLKIKNFKEIVLLDDYSSLIIYDLNKNKKINSFNMSSFESYDDSILIKIEKSDKSGYIIYNLVTNEFVEISGENIFIDVYPNYYTVLNRNKVIYYNADFESIYEVSLNN